MSDSNGNGREGRAANGRFAKGWKGGPGNIFASRVHAYRVALYEAISEADVKALVRRMLQAVHEGDMAAAKILVPYLFGKAPELVEDETDPRPFVLLEEFARTEETN